MKVYRSNVFEEAVHEANVLPLESKTLKLLGANPALMLICILKVGAAQDNETVSFHKDDVSHWTGLKVPAQLAALGKLADNHYCEFVYSSSEDIFKVTFTYSIGHIMKAVSLGLTPYELHLKEENEENEIPFPSVAASFG